MRRSASARSRLNLTVPAELIAEARKAKLNLSRLLQEKLEETLSAERARRWLEENREAIQAYNAHVEQHGLWHKGLTPWY